jgi:Protein of unknown function (DUF3237)
LSGRRAKWIPLQEARFDLAVTGRGKGRLSGRAHGVDYLRIRADRRIELGLHLTVETDDGHRIPLSGDGQAAQRNDEPMLDIFANIRFSTATKKYASVNARQIWSEGPRAWLPGRFMSRHPRISARAGFKIRIRATRNGGRVEPPVTLFSEAE